RVSITWPSASSTERSTRTDSSMPGRWTFTTTGEPSGSCARYTWPIDAAATGCQSKAGNTSGSGVSSSSSSTSAIEARGAGRTWSCSRPSSAAAWGEIRSVRVESTWPSFTNIPPHSSSARRSRRADDPPDRARHHRGRERPAHAEDAPDERAGEQRERERGDEQPELVAEPLEDGGSEGRGHRGSRAEGVTAIPPP